MSGRIVQGTDLTADVELDCDVCIVGSGAGGSVLAARLAAAGKQVILLEEGGYFARPDFDLNLARAFSRYYQDGGRRATEDLAITVLQGRAVGGTTLINWTTCYRTPDGILALWQARHGVDTLSTEVLTPHWEAVEARLGIEPWSAFDPNPQNSLLARGCEAMGWDHHILRRNVRGCGNTGYCGHGCPLDAKQAMHLTYLPDALRAGAELYADTRAVRFERDGRRVIAVHAEVLDRETTRPTGVAVTVRAKTFVLSGGAINSPALLLRSGFTEGPVGERTFLHPVVAVSATYDEPVQPWAGAPQSVASHQFIERGEDMGLFFEVPPMHPVLASVATPDFGSEELDFLSQLTHSATFIALARDGVGSDVGGTVRIDERGRIRLAYPLTDTHRDAFRFAHRALASLHLAAGANTVRTLHSTPFTLTSERDLRALDDLPYGAHQHNIFTAHQMGGCAMGNDATTSVVDPHLRHHHHDNLFVVDGSVFPTSLGVNPSESIYGVAHWAADHIADSV